MLESPLPYENGSRRDSGGGGHALYLKRKSPQEWGKGGRVFHVQEQQHEHTHSRRQFLLSEPGLPLCGWFHSDKRRYREVEESRPVMNRIINGLYIRMSRLVAMTAKSYRDTSITPAQLMLLYGGFVSPNNNKCVRTVVYLLLNLLPWDNHGLTTMVSGDLKWKKSRIKWYFS